MHSNTACIATQCCVCNATNHVVVIIAPSAPNLQLLPELFELVASTGFLGMATFHERIYIKAGLEACHDSGFMVSTRSRTSNRKADSLLQFQNRSSPKIIQF